MDGQQLQAIFGTVAFVVAFVVGTRSSWWLTKRYNAAKIRIEERNRIILVVMVFASWVITVTAGWIGALSAVRLLTNLTFPWTPPITLGFATVIVFIPYLFKWAIGRVYDSEDSLLIPPLPSGQATVEGNKDGST